ncbi:MAG TPA: dCTP deaminase [Egibacteraceae bacterium]|nr:dCTP deaminase [Egibacteraceae bacterium]
MILSDRDIRAELDAGRIVIEPLADDAIQPASVDVRIDDSFRVFANHKYPYIDVRAEQPDMTELVKVAEGEAFILHPGEFVLASTYERVELADDLVGRIEGKSSLGRLGLLTHATAGFVDPGWQGWLTLELSNVANLPIAIYPGMKIGQMAFFRLSSAAEVPYGAGELRSKYKGQRGPTASRYYENFHNS